MSSGLRHQDAGRTAGSPGGTLLTGVPGVVGLARRA